MSLGQYYSTGGSVREPLTRLKESVYPAGKDSFAATDRNYFGNLVRGGAMPCGAERFLAKSISFLQPSVIGVQPARCRYCCGIQT